MHLPFGHGQPSNAESTVDSSTPLHICPRTWAQHAGQMAMLTMEPNGLPVVFPTYCPAECEGPELLTQIVHVPFYGSVVSEYATCPPQEVEEALERLF